MALLVLLFLQLHFEALLLAARLLEIIVAAGIKRELALIEMHDRRHGAVEEIAIVTDDQHGVRIGLEMVLEPKRAFEIEVVRRLVEQQNVGLEKQDRAERHTHAPAAGEFPAGAPLGFLVEA